MRHLSQLLLLSIISIVVLSHSLVTASNPQGQRIRTPPHVLSQRAVHHRRALLKAKLTIGSLLNLTITDEVLESNTATSTSLVPSQTTTTSVSSTSSSPQKPVGSTSSNISTCFPFNSKGFTDGKVPEMSRKDWWCEDEEMYGFLGFSYPLEISDCSDRSNQLAKITTDLKRMKDEFGATFVRPYGVECRDVSIWENLVKACVELEMALIVQVWWGFQEDQSLWKKGQSSIYELFTTSSHAEIAPYIVYSASFGSEPVGDWVDGDNFIQDLTSFRSKMNSFGVPVGISEDWDRPDRMRDGSLVAGIGTEVLANTDVAQLHVMAYYHPDEVPTIDETWQYTKQQVQWARQALKQPTMITETMWSSAQGGSHSRGSHDDQSTLENYVAYWNTFSSNCEFFKEMKTGYFVHTYDDSQEPYFGMVDSTGETKIKNWKPTRC